MRSRGKLGGMSRSGPMQPMGRAERALAKHPSHAAGVRVATRADEVAILWLFPLVLSPEKSFWGSHNVPAQISQ